MNVPLSTAFTVSHRFWVVVFSFCTTLVAESEEELKSLLMKVKVDDKKVKVNDTIDQLDLIDIYRTFHPPKNEFHLFLKHTRNLLQDRSHPGP